MINLEEMKETLESIGTPVAYYAFKEPQEPPYICYYSPGTDNFQADGHVYYRVDEVNVELYQIDRDLELEDKVEKALSSFAWQSTTEYLTDENVYLTTYEMEG